MKSTMRRTGIGMLAINMGLLAGLLGTTGAALAKANTKPVAAPPVTISPLPGTPAALPQTQISFLGVSLRNLSHLVVSGSSSGRHPGRLKSYQAVTGTSFLPSRPFKAGERVTVSARDKLARGSRTLTTHFTVGQSEPVPLTGFPIVKGAPTDVQSFQSRPDLTPPTVTVTTPASGAAPGLVFTTPTLGPGQHGPLIFDNSGALVWSHPLSGENEAENLQLQQYRGKPVLTWWEGQTLTLGYGLGTDKIFDTSYKSVATIRAGNGMQADGHEFLITPQGTAIIVAYSPVRANLSSVGGAFSGIAVDTALQEIDIKTGLVVWQWNSMGHVGLDESYSSAPGNPANAFDYFHLNSVFVNGHGDLLVGARNTWGAYLISKRTGAIMWRLGGKKSTFAMGPGAQFAYQHDVRLQPNGLVSVFDDEGAPVVTGPSRAELIKLDQTKKTATLVQQFTHSPALQTFSQGNAQALSNGDWMVGWGGLPNLTEFNAQGQPVFDASFPTGEDSYRAYRTVWAGQPTDSPAVAATHSATGAEMVYASWNGATGVASWQVLVGASATTLTPVATAARSGFETTISLPGGAPNIEVRALSSTGKVLGTSKVVSG
jgi:Arylsulfotransferase (ASST)